ncbi:hypothetical protein ACFL3F_00930 [Planctomycetota bacterium]
MALATSTDRYHLSHIQTYRRLAPDRERAAAAGKHLQDPAL